MESVMLAAEKLKTPLPTDSSRVVEIMEAAANAEVIGYSIAKVMHEVSCKMADLDKMIAIKRMESLSENKSEKVAIAEAKADADVSSLVQDHNKLEADIKYLKYVGSLVEKRTSLAQSILSNITAQIKTGIQQ